MMPVSRANGPLAQKIPAVLAHSGVGNRKEWFLMQTQNTTQDKTTWDGGMSDAQPRAAALLADENYAGYYELLCDYRELMERTPCNFYSGQMDGCRAAMRAHAAMLGENAGKAVAA